MPQDSRHHPSGILATERAKVVFFAAEEHRPPHLRVGHDGEAVAAAYLCQKGYELHDRNVRVGKGEIDIVAFDPRDQTLVFCEIKSRKTHSPHYLPELNMTPQKRLSMLQAGRGYVAAHGWEAGYRFDCVYVEHGVVTQHIEDLDIGHETE